LNSLYLQILREVKCFLIEGQTKKKEKRLIQRVRIHLGNMIHDYIMSPTINMGDPEDKMLVWSKHGGLPTGERPFNKTDTTLLLYLYKGIDADGNLENKENVKLVDNEINERVSQFVEALSEEERAVFLRDHGNIIKFLEESRNPEKEAKYETMYLAKRAPGGFAHFDFAKRHRAVYADTTTYGGAIDFMFKSTPELHNINPQHHFLFKLENIIGRAAGEIKKQGYSEQMYSAAEDLTYEQYYSNYNQGTTVFRIKKELESVRPIYQQDSIGTYYIMANNEMLRLFYNIHLEGDDAKVYSDEATKKTFINSIQLHMSNFLKIQEKKIKKYQYPERLIRMRMMKDKDMLPLELIDDRNKGKMTKLFDQIKSFDDLDEYSFIFPLNPKKVPQEIKKDTYEKQLRDRSPADRLKSSLDDIKSLVDFAQPISLDIVQSLIDKISDLDDKERKEITRHMEEIELSIEDIEELTISSVEVLETLLTEIDNYISHSDDVPEEMINDLINTIGDLDEKELSPYTKRIQSILVHLENK